MTLVRAGKEAPGSADNVAGAGASIELRLPLRRAAQADEEQAPGPHLTARPEARLESA